MIKSIVLFRLWLSAVLLLAMSLNAQVPTGATVSAAYVQAPLMKGMPSNAVIQVRVYVPGGKEINYKSLQLNISEDAVLAIEKIDILQRADGEAAFLSNAPVLASVRPSSGLLTIPFHLMCHPGLTYFWISAVIKNSADMDKKIKMSVTGLTTTNDAIHTVRKSMSASGNATDFAFRIGMALRKAGDDNINTYRIPGIITTGRGTLITVYDVRYNNSRDLPGNIDVGMSRSTDGGKTWEPMKIVMDMGAPQENNGIGDPSILFDPVTKKLWIAALWSKGNRSIAGSEPGFSPDSTGQFVLVSSNDDGLTWSQPFSITTQVKNPAWHIYFQGPGNGIAMQNGTLVFPTQYWDETKKPGIPHSSIVYSTDHGQTWKSGVGAKSNTTESGVIETTPGTLMLNMRDNRGNYRSIATTTDMGKTWTEHQTSQDALPDPVCMAGILKARVNVNGKRKDVVFFCNVANQNSRQQTTLKASLDLGESWLPGNQLLVDARKTYGYSDLAKIDDNTIGIVYEGAGDLYFVRIPVNEIIH